jgi:solute:Na+ symporter, SSS family
MIKITSVVLTTFLFAVAMSQPSNYFKWKELAELPAVSGQNKPYGVAGPFAGVHNDALIIAGGANFPEPRWETKKTWHSDIWVLDKEKDSMKWIFAGKLENSIGYGMSVSTPFGVLCMGGADQTTTYNKVFLVQWLKKEKKIRMVNFPDLPKKCAYGCPVFLDNKVFILGGTETIDLKSAMKNFWMLDLDGYNENNFNGKWIELPAWPGPSRGFNMAAAQHNGKSDCIYVIGGRTEDEKGIHFLRDICEFNYQSFIAGKKDCWIRKKDAPNCVMAGEAFAVGQNHIYFFGWGDEKYFFTADSIKEAHPGFPKYALAYHTITDTWIDAGPIPVNQVTTVAVKWGKSFIIPCGEIRPRTRSPKIWEIQPQIQKSTFSNINLVALISYFTLILAIGVFFYFRNANTNDFFRGGQRVPAWAAGISIFATMLSSLTVMAIPAKTYTTDWVFFFINLSILIVAPFIIAYILPFFRRIDATSAYEYLEKRFNLPVRLFASTSFILYQIGRMAIVMFLPSLALSALLPVSVTTCILLMGVISIIYCTLGGLEAVIWTDAVQAMVLLSGVFISIVVAFMNINGGIHGFFSVANEYHKFHMVNWDFSAGSFCTTAFWVVLIGGLSQQLIPYSSDQSIVQRYLSVSSEDKAKKAIWTNAIISFPASILFFTIGTALFVFYHQHPQKLDPNIQNDAIFALYIARELPVGIAGLMVAGIFAAAQSASSASMNSISTAFITDFVKRFDNSGSSKNYLGLARLITILAGTLGVCFALFLSSHNVVSLWDIFMEIIGLFGGVMCGLFLLGMFTKKANGTGAIIGAIAGVIIVWTIQHFTHVHFLLYSTIAIFSCFVIGYFASLLTVKRDKSDSK